MANYNPCPDTSSMPVLPPIMAAPLALLEYNPRCHDGCFIYLEPQNPKHACIHACSSVLLSELGCHCTQYEKYIEGSPQE